MTRRSAGAGILAATALAALSAGVIALAEGPGHVATQARADRPYLAAIIGGFGLQVGLLVELRHRRRSRHLEQAAAGAGAGASAVGMVACCAHHAVDVVPLIGVSGAAAFLTSWRTEVMLAGIAVNAVGVAVAALRLRDARRHVLLGGSAWHPV